MLRLASFFNLNCSREKSNLHAKKCLGNSYSIMAQNCVVLVVNMTVGAAAGWPRYW